MKRCKDATTCSFDITLRGDTSHQNKFRSEIKDAAYLGIMDFLCSKEMNCLQDIGFVFATSSNGAAALLSAFGAVILGLSRSLLEGLRNGSLFGLSAPFWGT